MIKISEQDAAYVREHFEDAEELISSDDPNDLLLVLDLYIVKYGFDQNYDLNDIGEEAQKIYDRIYYANEYANEE